MSIAVIRNDALSRKQPVSHSASNLSVVESAAQPRVKFAVQGVRSNLYQSNEVTAQQSHHDDRLLNARQVADKLGVSERWVRDHTTRRSPRIRGIKLGPLMRYRREDVDAFMAELDTLPLSRRSPFGV
jgi:predicted DNA-binding transcriptional regulator AlpA